MKANNIQDGETANTNKSHFHNKFLLMTLVPTTICSMRRPEPLAVQMSGHLHLIAKEMEVLFIFISTCNALFVHSSTDEAIFIVINLIDKNGNSNLVHLLLIPSRWKHCILRPEIPRLRACCNERIYSSRWLDTSATSSRQCLHTSLDQHCSTPCRGHSFCNVIYRLFYPWDIPNWIKNCIWKFLTSYNSSMQTLQ